MNRVIQDTGAPAVFHTYPSTAVVFNTGSYDMAFLNTGSRVSFSGGVIFRPMSQDEPTLAHYYDRGLINEGDVNLFCAGSLSLTSQMEVNTDLGVFVVGPIGVTRQYIGSEVVFQKIHGRIGALSGATF